MKRYRLHALVLGVVTAWAVFSSAYLGVEDGSSGLSPLGWVHVLFFLHPAVQFGLVRAAHSNSNLVLTAATVG